LAGTLPTAEICVEFLVESDVVETVITHH
jgi:hypothetical protein